MNWIKENKFLAGFLVVMLVGMSALGYLVFDAMGRADTASENYARHSADLARLQNLPLSPSKKNLDALVLQKTEAVKVVDAFQASLAAKSFPLEPMTPEQFQDKLKATKTAIFERAAEGGTKLPAKFFLGFDAYETTPPKPEAATPLGRQLKASEWVLNQAFANHITEVDGKEPMKRQMLAEETGRKAEELPKQGGGPGRKEKQMLVTHSFEIKMQCRQDQLGGFLNAIVGPQAPQFYIPRLVQVANEKPSVPKADAAKPADAVAAVAADGKPAEGQPAQNKPSGYFLGTEHLAVTLLIEVVDFAEPASAAKAAANK